MAKLTRKDAKELLDSGLIDQKTYEGMVEQGYVSSGTRSKRPNIIVPADQKGEFLDKAYEALEGVAKEMGLEDVEETETTGKATVYLAGAGSPRNDDEDEEEDENELTEETEVEAE